jgi:glycosyltransferase involved in cell wall biosynthesis
MIKILLIKILLLFTINNAFAASDFNFKEKDYQLFKSCIALVERGKIKNAIEIAINDNNFLITKIFNWYYFKDKDLGANFYEITNYMKFILDHPEKAREMGIKNKKNISENYTLEKHLNQLKNTLNEIIVR